MPLFKYLSVTLCACVALAVSVNAGETKKPKVSRIDTMALGPFVSYSLGRVGSPDQAKAYATIKEAVVLKGISVKLGKSSAVCFDTDLMRYAVGWTGGFLDFSNSNIGQERGNEPVSAVGTLRFGNKSKPGVGINGEFKDSRLRPVGPLPYEYAKYKGLYVNGDKVIFSYTIKDVEVLDMPEALEADDNACFVRTIQVGPSKDTLEFALCDQTTFTGVSSANEMSVGGTPAVVKVAPHDKVLTFKVAVASDAKFATAFDKVKNSPVDLATLCKGGAPHWTQTVETQGVLGKPDGAYVVDTVTEPEKNPYNSWMRAGGFDFFSDASRAAICTMSGDVWIVSGIDDTLKKLTWRRFATGMYEPLGLKIVDDKIYVLGRDQITRLHDLNGDGEADFYENFCSKWNISPSYHAFSFDLWTDKDGNFYYANDSNQVEIGLPGHGVVFKISKDGSKIEELAHGLRAPNGMAVGPNGEIVVSDNQGYWTPSSKINWVKAGADMFLGHPGDPRKNIKGDPDHQYKVPAGFDPPLCWIPHKLDTSSGGEAFVTSDKWGPFGGGMIHLSYGTCSLFYVMSEDVDGQMQGGTVKFPLQFASGIMRARFNPKDGQLYVCGLRGWQTNGPNSSTFCRVRYTGKPVCMPLSVKTHPTGIDITFTCPLDEAAAKDVENYAIEQWNYNWTAAYGSKDYKASNPKEEGHDPVPVQYVNISADRKTVSLALPEVKPVMQMGIRLKLKGADGTPIRTELDYTINKVGK